MVVMFECKFVVVFNNFLIIVLGILFLLFRNKILCVVGRFIKYRILIIFFCEIFFVGINGLLLIIIIFFKKVGSLLLR